MQVITTFIGMLALWILLDTSNQPSNVKQIWVPNFIGDVSAQNGGFLFMRVIISLNILTDFPTLSL